jgi:hypothetical protein
LILLVLLVVLLPAGFVSILFYLVLIACLFTSLPFCFVY